MNVISPHNYEGCVREYIFTDGKNQHSVTGIIIPTSPKTFSLLDTDGNMYEISNSAVCSGNIIINEVGLISRDKMVSAHSYLYPLYENAREYVDIVNQIRQLERKKIQIVGERFNLYAERGVNNAISDVS